MHKMRIVVGELLYSIVANLIVGIYHHTRKKYVIFYFLLSETAFVFCLQSPTQLFLSKFMKMIPLVQSSTVFSSVYVVIDYGKTDMIKMYGLVDGNSRLATRMFAKCFPGRTSDIYNTTYVVWQLSETECLVHNKRNRVVCHRVQNEERVLNAFHENLGISVRRAARELNLSRCTLYFMYE